MKKLNTLLIIIALGALLSACGAKKRNINMKIHSDPLGAYSLMQVKYAGNENSDWIFLGPTPVTMERTIAFKGATQISLKVFRTGFFEQVKSWTPKDFIKENKERNGILWVPNMVQQ